MNLEDAVLLAISAGIRDADAISRRLNVNKDDVLIAIDNLKAEGLVVEKRRFLGRHYELTRSGFEKAEQLKEGLKKIAQEFRYARERNDKEKLERLYNEYSYLIPLMVSLDLLDTLLFIDFFNFLF